MAIFKHFPVLKKKTQNRVKLFIQIEKVLIFVTITF